MNRGKCKLSTGRMGWMAQRKWKEIKQEPGTAGPGNMLGCSLLSFHFLWAIHPIRPVVRVDCHRLPICNSRKDCRQLSRSIFTRLCIVGPLIAFSLLANIGCSTEQSSLCSSPKPSLISIPAWFSHPTAQISIFYHPLSLSRLSHRLAKYIESLPCIPSQQI